MEAFNERLILDGLKDFRATVSREKNKSPARAT